MIEDAAAVVADLRKVANTLVAQAERWGEGPWTANPRAAVEEAAAILSDAADELAGGVRAC